MIYQDDISTAKAIKTPFEAKAAPTAGEREPDHRATDEDFGRHLAARDSQPKSATENADKNEFDISLTQQEAMSSTRSANPITFQIENTDNTDGDISGPQTDDSQIARPSADVAEIEARLSPQDISLVPDVPALPFDVAAQTPDSEVKPDSHLVSDKALLSAQTAQNAPSSGDIKLAQTQTAMGLFGTQIKTSAQSGSRAETASLEPLADEAQLLDTSELLLDIDGDLAAEKLVTTRLHKEALMAPSLIEAKPLRYNTSSTLSETSVFSVQSTPTIQTTPSLMTTSASTAFATLTAPSLQTVMQSIVKTVETQKGVSVRLDPPEMGRVYIDYIFDGERSVSAVLRADLPEAMAQLKDHAAQLQDYLKEHGFDDVNLSFEQNSSNTQQDDDTAFQNRVMTVDSQKTVETQLSLMPAHSTLAPYSIAQNTSLDIKL